jgi:ferredoxin
VRVVVDQAKCMGHARCVALLPQVFQWIDVEDHAFVPDDVDLTGLEESLHQAALICPEGAIVVEE